MAEQNAEEPKRETRSDIHGNRYYIWTCRRGNCAHHTQVAAELCNRLFPQFEPEPNDER